MKRFVTSRTVLAALFLSVISLCSHAREPGIAPNMPPGLTLGVPIAVNPPPGWYLTNRMSYASYTLRDASGGYNGQDATIAAESMQLTWLPGTQLLGASYKAFVIVPLVNMDMTRTTTTTGKLGTWHVTGLANPKIQPLDLSWNLGHGWSAVSGLGFYAPLGYYSKNAPLSIGGNFWTLEPSAGITYLRDNWHFSAHLVYNTNTRNHDNEYRSGDQVFLNLTLTRAFGAWKLGPVAYYQEQITPDSNGGGRPTFGGQVFADPRQVGAGLLASTDWGKAKLTAFVTRDVQARNTMAGDKVWFNLSLPF